MAEYRTMDPSKMSFAEGFEPKDLRIIEVMGSKVISTFEGEFRGRKYFQVRELWEQYGVWHPGKGLSIPLERRDAFISALVRQYEE